MLCEQNNSSAFAVTRKKLVKQCLQDLIWNHIVSLSKVVAACWTSVDLGSERALQAAFAHIVETRRCDRLIHQLLTADAHECLFNILQKFWTFLDREKNFVPKLLVRSVLLNEPVLLFSELKCFTSFFFFRTLNRFGWYNLYCCVIILCRSFLVSVALGAAVSGAAAGRRAVLLGVILLALGPSTTSGSWTDGASWTTWLGFHGRLLLNFIFFLFVRHGLQISFWELQS